MAGGVVSIIIVILLFVISMMTTAGAGNMDVTGDGGVHDEHDGGGALPAETQHGKHCCC